MATIALDATSSNQGAGVSSLSWSHTCFGSERLLVVGTSVRDGTASDRPVTSITYNSINLTKIRSDDSGNSRSEIWYLVNPASGANTIQVNFSGINVNAQAGGVSLTGVDQTSALDAHNGASGTSISPSVSVTTVSDNAWVIDALVVQNLPAITVGAGQTKRWVEGNTNSKGRGSSEGPKTPPGAVTMSWSLGSSQPWRISAASFSRSTIVIVSPPALALTAILSAPVILWTSNPAVLAVTTMLPTPKVFIVVVPSVLVATLTMFTPSFEIKFVTRLMVGRRDVNFVADQKKTLFNSSRRDTQIIVRSKRK